MSTLHTEDERNGYINDINSNSLDSLATGNCKLYYYWGANLRIIDNRHSLNTGQNH